MHQFKSMQTFLPYSDFEKTTKVLDYRRLGKQRVEAYQILLALSGKSKGWINHPATKMWRGHSLYLCDYMNSCIKEWIHRGYKNTMNVPYEMFENELRTAPEWLGSEAFHSSHRSALLYKNFEHYSKFGWNERPELNYIWPIS